MTTMTQGREAQNDTNILLTRPSAQSLNHAKYMLRQGGVDPEQMAESQLNAFATTTLEAQPKPLEIYLKSLRIHQDSHGHNDDGQSSTTSEPPEEKAAAFQATAQNLVRRCKEMLAEVEQWVEALHEKKLSKGERAVEYRALRNDIRSELSFLEKLSEMDGSEEKAYQYLVSSNLLFFEALWAAAKRTSGLLCFRKNFFFNKATHNSQGANQGGSLGNSRVSRRAPGSKGVALVDIVSCDGLEWTKVSTISEKRLLFDLAKLGWQNDGFSDDDEDGAEDHRNTSIDSDNEDEVPLVKSAKDLAKAAASNRTMGKHPRVVFVLPRIESGRITAIDNFLNKIRATGAIVQCADDLEPAPPLESVLPKLLVDRSRNLSETLNIDCTILLAIISDISHSEVPMQDWFPRAVRAQIKAEAEDRLLPTQLYPTMDSHPMVCTTEAAVQMKEIVATIGTDTEKARAQILLGEDEEKPRDELLKEWRQLSEYQVPEGLQLPIKVVKREVEGARLPPVAEAVAAQLSPINKSVFLYGWATGFTTLSSNRTVAKQIEHIIAKKGTDEADVGPSIWLCGEARSLVARQGRQK